jgi:hypothetical protein
LLLKIVDRIASFLGTSRPDWSGGQWKRRLYSPPELQRQLDSWSCGLFVLMAISAIKQRVSFQAVTDDLKLEMRDKVLEILLAEPCVFRL